MDSSFTMTSHNQLSLFTVLITSAEAIQHLRALWTKGKNIFHIISALHKKSYMYIYVYSTFTQKERGLLVFLQCKGSSGCYKSLKTDPGCDDVCHQKSPCLSVDIALNGSQNVYMSRFLFPASYSSQQTEVSQATGTVYIPWVLWKLEMITSVSNTCTHTHKKTTVRDVFCYDFTLKKCVYRESYGSTIVTTV